MRNDLLVFVLALEDLVLVAAELDEVSGFDDVALEKRLLGLFIREVPWAGCQGV